MDRAGAARGGAGRDPDSMECGADGNVVVHDDPDMARRLGEGGLSLFARFQAMHGHTVGPASEEGKRTSEAVHDAYDMTRHNRAGSPQAGKLTSAFATEFGVFGPSVYCIERLQGLIEMGLTRLMIVGGTREADPAEVSNAQARFVEEVLPALR